MNKSSSLGGFWKSPGRSRSWIDLRAHHTGSKEATFSLSLVFSREMPCVSEAFERGSCGGRA